MCIIALRTQHGEISFCAYTCGGVWRQIIENMHKNGDRLPNGTRFTQTRNLRKVKAVTALQSFEALAGD